MPDPIFEPRYIFIQSSKFSFLPLYLCLLHWIKSVVTLLNSSLYFESCHEKGLKKRKGREVGWDFCKALAQVVYWRSASFRNSWFKKKKKSLKKNNTFKLGTIKWAICFYQDKLERIGLFARQDRGKQLPLEEHTKDKDMSELTQKIFSPSGSFIPHKSILILIFCLFFFLAWSSFNSYRFP